MGTSGNRDHVMPVFAREWGKETDKEEGERDVGRIGQNKGERREAGRGEKSGQEKDTLTHKKT